MIRLVAASMARGFERAFKFFSGYWEALGHSDIY